MREIFRTSAVLVRYGWRSAWGAFALKQPRPGLRVLMLMTFSYLPLIYFYQSYRTFQQLGDTRFLKRMFTEWNLPSAAFMESSPLWPEVPHVIGLGISVLFLAIFVSGIPAVYLMQRKGSDTDLEWMRTFPITLRSALWGRLLQSTVIQPYLILLLLPFLLTFAVVRGHNILFSVVTLSLLAWITMLAASSLSLMLHSFTSFNLSPARQRDFRVLVTFVMIAAFFLFYFPFTAMEGLYWQTIFRIAPSLEVTGLHEAMTSLLSGEASSLAPILSLGGAVLLLAHGSIVISERIVTQGSPAQERAPQKEGRILERFLDSLSPVMRRELRVLIRDRSQWAPLITAPLVTFGLIFAKSFSDESLVQGKSLLLVCLLMYLMMIGLGLQTLFQRERPNLWFYAAMPMRLSEVLRVQRKVPSVVFGILYGVILVALAPSVVWQDVDFVSRLALGLYFISIVERLYRSVALLSYTPTTENTVGKPFYLVVLMTLTPAFAMIVMEGEVWTVAAFLILCTALASSFKKKVLALEDYLIDPSYPLPRTADLAHGFFAALIYSTMLVVANNLAFMFDLNRSVQFLVAAVTLWTLHYYYSSRQVNDVPVYVGAVRFLDLVVLGLGCAFLVRAAGFWERLTLDSAFLEHMYQDISYRAAPATAILFFILIARSVTEELIFRGLVQRGLTQRLGFPAALIISAVLTTLCQRPQDLGPVLLTSLVSGFLYHRTKVLWPGIALTIAAHGLKLLGF